MDIKTLLPDLHKRKISIEDLYLLSLRQMLLNQIALLLGAVGNQEANNSKKLVERIEQFMKEKE